MRLALLSLSILLAFAADSRCAQSPATQPATLELADLTGVRHRPLDPAAGHFNVVIFISTNCPISNSYAPEINRLCKEYESKGVSFFLVHSDPDLTMEAAKKHAADYGFTCPILIDRKHDLVHALGAKVQSYAALVGPAGQMLYHGRIDNLYVSVGRKRFEATTHELRDSLDAILAGKPAPIASTTAVGCAISDD
jgi:thiol-disulfide isomerase/thioredoxin